jgi:hypothetical protein
MKPKTYNVGLMAHISLKTSSKESWYFDSVCSRHLTGSKDLLNIEKTCTNSYVVFGNQTRGKILGSGRLISPESPKLDNVLLVNGLTTNLISISQLCDQGMRVDFSKSACVVTDKKREVIMRGIKSKGNCYLWIPPYKDQTKELTGSNQALILEKSECVSQCTCEDKFTSVENRLLKHVILEKGYVEQDVSKLCPINLSTIIVPQDTSQYSWLNSYIFKFICLSEKNTTTWITPESQDKVVTFNLKILDYKLHKDLGGILEIAL